MIGVTTGTSSLRYASWVTITFSSSLEDPSAKVLLFQQLIPNENETVYKYLIRSKKKVDIFKVPIVLARKASKHIAQRSNLYLTFEWFSLVP